MAKFKIVQKLEDCIGCGACVSICPANWELKGDKAKPKKADLDAVGCNQEAANVCPVQCIKIVKK